MIRSALRGRGASPRVLELRFTFTLTDDYRLKASVSVGDVTLFTVSDFPRLRESRWRDDYEHDRYG